MVNYKSLNNIILDMIGRLRLSQPNLDIKPGTVARDLMIDNQASEMSILYDALRQISFLQSVVNLSGIDLINYASNYGIQVQDGTKSSGVAVLTFRTIDSDISISSGSVIRTKNGIPFLTISDIFISTSQINSLRATGTRLRNQLATAGISDQFAVEVSVEAQSPGAIGNIGSYSLTSSGIPDVTGITNLTSFTGGSNQENDDELRSRVLAAFAGANIGTAISYKSVILNLANALDAFVVEPGDALMTRDGTVVTIDSGGNLIVSEPGSGGRVDIYVLGENIQTATDSFVYNDNSGSDNPVDSSNDYVLGQTSLTPGTSLTINSRRVAVLSKGASIPNQPISKIVSVSGSSSGPNFVEQYLGDDNQLKGNYKLEKDTGSAGGSPFALDKLVWTDSKIELSNQLVNKSGFNSVDGLGFTDVGLINGVSQDIQILNENANVMSSDRSFIYLSHTPIKTVSRVFNLTTGERYTIIDQTPDDNGDKNTSGRIQISGRSLPNISDILQVDYTWIFSYDKYYDFDNLEHKDALNLSQDSIDWGFCNYVRNEIKNVSMDAYGVLTVGVDLPVDRVVSVNTFSNETLLVTSSKITTSNDVENILNIKDITISGSPEIYNTELNDGSFSGKVVLLPSDSIAEESDSVSITYNLNNIFENDQYGSGTHLNKVITLPTSSVVSGTSVLVNYVANFSNLIPLTQIIDLPISSNGLNGFLEFDGYQPVQNQFSSGVVSLNRRRTPSKLVVTSSNITNNGKIRVVGTTINKVTAVFTNTISDLIELSAIIKSEEGLGDLDALPTGVSISKVAKIENVTLDASLNVVLVNSEYDVLNYSIYNNKWDKDVALSDGSLTKTQIKLSSVNPLITTGTNLRITFYYSKEFDFEDLFFSRNGFLITNKTFGHINSINKVFGFENSNKVIQGSIKIDSLNQPNSGSNYYVDYSYTAPKENERITINYEYNKLIVDATEAIEDKRPITSDILVKGASKKAIDVSASVVVLSSFQDKTETVQQDVVDKISSALSSTELGTTIDKSDIINSIYDVAGVDRVRITKFNLENTTGIKESIIAQKNEYISPGTIEVIIEER
jgi:uncharacterized phage protein gp47/JayE